MIVIRWILARIILVVDFLYRPTGIKRSTDVQAALDKSLSTLALYQYAACPFCVKVRWAMKRNTLNIETRDAKRNPEFAKELEEQGGALKVPCLRIEEESGAITWMYESNDIIDYLENRSTTVATA